MMYVTLLAIPMVLLLRRRGPGGPQAAAPVAE